MHQTRHSPVRVSSARLPLRLDDLWQVRAGGPVSQVVGEQPDPVPFHRLDPTLPEYAGDIRHGVASGYGTVASAVPIRAEGGQRISVTAFEAGAHRQSIRILELHGDDAARSGNSRQRPDHRRGVLEVHKYAVAQYNVEGLYSQNVRGILARAADKTHPPSRVFVLGGERVPGFAQHLPGLIQYRDLVAPFSQRNGLSSTPTADIADLGRWVREMLV